MNITKRPICKLDDCDKPHKARGYCKTHYYRVLRGIPLDLPLRYRGGRKAKDIRIEVITLLGGMCAQCGYSENYLGMDIDHINNDGAEQRRQLGKIKGGNKKYYQSMLDSGGEGLQILCGTCHNIKTRS